MKANNLLIFRPQACPDQELLERTLFGREDLARQLVDRIRDSALGSSRHQQLVYGPRGSGKTHLLTVVFNRLRSDEALREHLWIARLAEEQWEIASFTDLCIQILRALAALYPDSQTSEWEKRLLSAPLPARKQEAPTAEICRGTLRLIKETIGQGLLLIMAENLDGLFDAIGRDGQHQLRAQIQQSDNWILLGSSQSLFRSLTSRQEPFFGFFQIHDLAPLDAAQTFGFCLRLAGDPAAGNPDLKRSLATPVGEQRMRAIHHLCSGNHRLLTMLYPFLAGEGLVELVEPFLQMIDQKLTPYYQERLQRLSSPQQRKIVSWLARAEKPQTMKVVARGCLVTEQVVSKQLRGLAELGFVLLKPRGRQTFCEVREPLLRMVLDLQEHHNGPVRLVVRVLRSWYSYEQLAMLDESERVRQVAMYHQSVQAALKEVRQEMTPQAYAALDEINDVTSLLEERRYAEALEQIATRTKSQQQQPLLKAFEVQALIGLQRWAEAEAAFSQARCMAEECQDEIQRAFALGMCGSAAADMGWLAMASELTGQAVKLHRFLAQTMPEQFRQHLATSLNNLGIVQRDLNDLEAARASHREALAIRRELARQRPEVYRADVAMTLNNLGIVQRALNDLEAARASFQEALVTCRELARQRPEVYRPYVAVTLNNLSLLLIRVGQIHEAQVHAAEAARELCAAYCRLAAPYRLRFLVCLLRWLKLVRNQQGTRAAQLAMADFAQSMPQNDPVARSILATMAIWAGDWPWLRATFSQGQQWAEGLLPAELDLPAQAFVEALLQSDAKPNDLIGVWNLLPEKLRERVEEQLIGSIRGLLQSAKEPVRATRNAAPRIEAVLGHEGLAGKAVELLQAGAAYLEAGKDENAILTLPEEQRRLIIAACSHTLSLPNSESSPHRRLAASG